jgi:phospholipid N-methyltransferase
MQLRNFGFLRESIRNLRSTGSVTPSSRYLCKAIAHKINPQKARVVVELGPGDGVITRYLLERIAPDARLLIFEINDTFVAQIRNNFSDARLTVIHDSAENMGLYFEQMGIEKVDYFVSGIPFVMLPEKLARNIVQMCYQWLQPRGLFIQFHYSPFLLPLYRSIFPSVKVDVVPLNFPPALVITGKKAS